MKSRFTVANKLLAGFGIVILLSIINGLLIFSTLNENKSINDELIEVYNPSSTDLQALYSLVMNSQMLVKNWVFIEKQEDTPDKRKLSDLHEFEFPQLKDEIEEIALRWSPEEREKLNGIMATITDTLFVSHKYIMDNLASFESYDDLMVLFEVTPMVEEGGEVIETTERILAQISTLKKSIDAKEDASSLAMSNSFDWFKKFVIITTIILSLIVIIAGYFTALSIVRPILKLKEFLTTMTRGVLPTEKLITKNDEIGDMGDSLNGYIENMRKTSQFAVEIGNGNYDTDFKVISKEDMLGNSLLEMRNNLRVAVQENKEREEADKIRNWITHGIAEFGDILRQNSDNMDTLASKVMARLTDYLNITQGAIYILMEEEDGKQQFEMKCAIAYDREKYLHTVFDVEEGLVGRCAFEKEPVYLKEIPEDYIKLKSGLGTAEPRQLLLVPLVANEKVMGVIELASFNDILEHQIEFVTALGENIASTISSVRINEQTKTLLNDSKLRADELSAQEEELRQNMEELQATQEEAQRREAEMTNTISAIDNTLGVIELDATGNMQHVNEHFTSLTQMAAAAFVGNAFKEVFISDNAMDDEFAHLWAELQSGNTGKFEASFIANDRNYWLSHTFTPFKDILSGSLIKVIDFVIDITEQKELEQELEKAKLDLN